MDEIIGNNILILNATIRDFKHSHPDFEPIIISGKCLDLVKKDLGADNKPVFNSTTCSNKDVKSIASEASFNQWYNTISGVNHAFDIEIELKNDSTGLFKYENNMFFPLTKNQGWGDEGYEQNFHFTTEIHANFIYMGKERFIFTGDDDLWVYINKKLVIDLGGTHAIASGDVDLRTLGLTIGESYPIDIFHAERRTDESNFSIMN